MSVHVPLALPSVSSRDGIGVGVKEVDGDGVGVFVKIHPPGQTSAVAEIHHVDTHPHGHEEIQFVIPFAVFSDAVFTSLHDGLFRRPCPGCKCNKMRFIKKFPDYQEA